MSNTVTLVSNTEMDPYSCYWAEVRDADAAVAVGYFLDSPGWSAIEGEPGPDVHQHFVSVECAGQPPRHFLAAGPDIADAASNELVMILGRGPDSVH